jgi:hypothetical protein
MSGAVRGVLPALLALLCGAIIGPLPSIQPTADAVFLSPSPAGINVAQIVILAPLFVFCVYMRKWETQDLVPIRPMEGEELPCNQARAPSLLTFSPDFN